LRFVFGAGLIASLLAYIINPSWMAWSSLALPAWVRWFGACLGIVALLLLVWTHQTLGRNFSATLHVRERHSLVTTGPYQWVRHPMYSSFYLLVLALFLVSANWFLGLAWFSVITGVMVTRLQKEEVLMLEAFGDQYYQYMKRTGRLVPRLF
jgi:protein-S-isoprenylcysteine O-methyltransferase Ste14